eukprot:2021940-Rhodomonas_salina.1
MLQWETRVDAKLQFRDQAFRYRLHDNGDAQLPHREPEPGAEGMYICCDDGPHIVRSLSLRGGGKNDWTPMGLFRSKKWKSSADNVALAVQVSEGDLQDSTDFVAEAMKGWDGAPARMVSPSRSPSVLVCLPASFSSDFNDPPAVALHSSYSLCGCVRCVVHDRLASCFLAEE